MAKFNGKFSSKKQHWETPDQLFKLILTKYQLDCDVAASAQNAKLPRFLSETDDALSRQWYGKCWLNPPYGGSGKNSLQNWVKKAFQEAQKPNCSVVMLLPVRSNTMWWHQYVMKAKEVNFIKGRPKFGNCKHGLPQPLAVVLFDGIQDCPTFHSLNANNVGNPLGKQLVFNLCG